MFFFRVCIMALRSLWIHPLRSILATLGVIIGVAAVVAAMAILEGMSARMATGFESMGSNKIYIMPEVERRGRRAVGSFDALELDDAYAIDRGCKSTINRVMPQINNSVTVKFLSKSTNASILGATEVYPLINSHNVAEGEFFSRSNVQGKASVVVIGAKVKQELFGGRPAIEEKIKISGLGRLGTRTQPSSASWRKRATSASPMWTGKSLFQSPPPWKRSTA
ncbi:MAG: ABC transporter permease [Planctomycetes bacterium]|nr:ABC transporter permease [Planctomycetota bacterium]